MAALFNSNLSVHSDGAAPIAPAPSNILSSTSDASSSDSGASEDETLGDLVDAIPAVLPPQASIHGAVQVMQAQGLSCVVVAEGGTILGLFTEQEVLDAVATGLDATATPISLCRVPQVPILRPNDSIGEALRVMQAANLRYLLVVDQQGQLCGLVPRQRLLQSVIDRGQRLAWEATAPSPSFEPPESGADLLSLGVQESHLPVSESAGSPFSDPLSDRGLTVLTHVHYQLLGQAGQNRLRVLTRCLKLLGQASEAVGAALFEIHLDGSGTTLTSLRAAWHRLGTPAVDHGDLQLLPLGRVQRWHEVLARGGMLTGAIASFPAAEQTLLRALGGENVLILPLRCHGQYFGFLVFSRRGDAPLWPVATVKLLRTASMSLSLACEQHTMQSCLRQTQSAFASLFHHSPDPMAVTTFPEGRHLLVNASYARWLGRASAEIIGRRPADLGMVHDRRQFAQLRRQIRDRGMIQNIEIDSRLTNGKTRTLLVSSELTQLNDQTCLLSIGKDITDRKVIQATLSAAEARFRAIFEQINVGMCQANLAGQVMDVNPGMCQMLGFSREELLTKSFPEFTHPDDLALDLSHYNRLLAGELDSFTIEKRYCHKHGGYVWISLMVCLVRNDDGEPLFSIGVSQDISERKRGEAERKLEEAERQAAEKALQTSHRRINNILESITDAFFALDQQWQFTYLNQRAEQFLRRSRHQVLGQNLWYEFPEVLGTQLSKELRRAMTERVSLTFEEDMASSDSWCEFHVYPSQEGLAVYFQDITSRKRAVEQIEHQIRREQALNRVVQAIRQSLDLDVIFDTAAREIALLLQADHVDIQMRQPADGRWRVLAEHREDDQLPSLLHHTLSDHTPVALSLNRLEIVQFAPGQGHPTGCADDPLEMLPGGWLLVPLHITGPLPWGCLGIHRRATQPEVAVEPWKASEIELVQTVADQLAIALAQAQTLAQAQAELRERQRAEARLKEAQRIAHTGNWELSLAQQHLTWSEEMFRIYGLNLHQPPPSIEDQLAALEDGDRPRWRQQLALASSTGQPLNLEGAILRPDGQRRFVQLLGQAQRNAAGEIISLVGTLTDITERKLIEDRLAYEALHDPLTGSPNRAFFMEQLNAAVQTAKTLDQAIFAVLFIDLDRFKVINDSLGHLVGDQLLIDCAQRLSSVVREGDLVARLGGDEFAILLNPIAIIDDALAVAQRIHQVLQPPLVLEGREIFISASVGIASNLTGAVEAVDFLRDADTAMYRAKENGRGRSALFDPAMHEQVATRLTLENDLQRAIARQELALHYQPIVDLTHHQLIGFEALVRWHHPRWGPIPPGTFVPLAEETGLILAIGEWTQLAACQQLQRWRQHLPAAQDLIMSVNLSVKQFAHPRLIATIDETLATTGLSSQYLRLEITESALIENAQTAESILQALRDRGIQLGIDDFGTGYSSLSMVHQFPMQILKIDRSFIQSMESDPRGVAMVQAILALAQSLGMAAIAEGVETESQLHQLRQLGCPYAQGYCFSKPLPAPEAEYLLVHWPIGPSSAQSPSAQPSYSGESCLN
ncbi:EAL domain-containing protein [Nodosilinea sp. E11]|uniref:EAL domain-containing protein n=1 Tax=Nodosilinea sp. E11 TaxID=3037479 RepID=UPI002934A425|nr:EAL domain-containing protein [Nodosilinea sp. E11]WOD40761.1 EAL domain-containing protein [Nodosilinea sp. E11]